MAVLSREYVSDLIAQGHVLVIYQGRVLKLDSWLVNHPGGDKAILHAVGRDATDEMNAYHSKETLWRMKAFSIGPVEEPWENFLPPIQGGLFNDPDNYERSMLDRGRSKPNVSFAVSAVDNQIARDLIEYPSLDFSTQSRITMEYRALDHRLRREGWYNCRYRDYLKNCLRYTSFLSLSMIFLHLHYYKLSALFLGILWHQLTFLAHDAGHLGITHHYFIDNIIGIFVADFVGGLSLGWWKRNHNVHHLVTNHPLHDPDIQHLPFFAIDLSLLNSIRSTYYDKILPYDPFAKLVVPFQNWTYYPLLCFGRFNLYRLSWDHILARRGPRKGKAVWLWYIELVGLIAFWYWFGYLLLYKTLPDTNTRIWYILISHVITMPLHVQITLSHFAMSTADLGIHESFAQKQLRTTMDVDCPEWLDFFHGGLQFQAIHHLFPRIPRHNLRRIQPLVREFCKKVGIEYKIYGFVHGNEIVLGRLSEIARQAKILGQAAKMASLG
ncbi:Delta 8-(E)-sphingolipid desaturase [Neolecta irregularis DAH-3]|uniref:Delta 8-(E)-sphingolipid desaturase n=1 Tax=Neolecta irregularis (strain DAH-3) TaxID=1198029 RepID=A0A1U7LTY9_NEOID|nr:Delta 8-(E)-sphingolipid desaturase [Neolecta irregularis DAH-3]|eukprot:OLL25981.1 Delta 8-(E)-sphingolipid desaturase [Neolecta irregularis DAH-3]